MTIPAAMMAAVDKSDSAQFSREEILEPTDWVLLNYLMPRDVLKALEREMPRRIVIFDMPPLLASDDVLAFAESVGVSHIFDINGGVDGGLVLGGDDQHVDAAEVRQALLKHVLRAGIGFQVSLS